MVQIAPLVADGGQLRLVRRLAAFAYGERDVTWPEDYDGPEKNLPDDRVFGYVAKLPGRAPGRSERRFTRSDIKIDAVLGTSETEQVLDEAERRTGGDAFVETVIEGRGLGRQVPGVDYRLSDRVPVRLWGRVLPSQLVTEVTWEGDRPSVKVGGQVLADLVALDRDVVEQKRAIAQERRERLRDVGEVSSRAAAAQSTANAAVEDAAAVREALGGVGASEATLVSQLAALNQQLQAQGEAQQPGLLPAYLDLNTRLWRQQKEIDAAQDATAKALKQAQDAQSSVVRALQQAQDAQQGALDAQARISATIPRIIHTSTGSANAWTSSLVGASNGSAFGSVNLEQAGPVANGNAVFRARGSWSGFVLMIAVNTSGSSDITAGIVTNGNGYLKSSEGTVFGSYKSATVFILPSA